MIIIIIIYNDDNDNNDKMDKNDNDYSNDKYWKPSFYQLCKGDDSAPHAFPMGCHQAQFGIECYLYSYIYKYGK